MRDFDATLMAVSATISSIFPTRSYLYFSATCKAQKLCISIAYKTIHPTLCLKNILNAWKTALGDTAPPFVMVSNKRPSMKTSVRIPLKGSSFEKGEKQGEWWNGGIPCPMFQSGTIKIVITSSRQDKSGCLLVVAERPGVKPPNMVSEI